MSLHRMLRKTVASLLLLLVASPFTAPCETCDVATLFGLQTTLSQVQLRLAGTIDADSQAVALDITAARRVQIGFKLVSNTPAAAFLSPDVAPRRTRALPTPPGRPSMPSLPRSPLRI